MSCRAYLYIAVADGIANCSKFDTNLFLHVFRVYDHQTFFFLRSRAVHSYGEKRQGKFQPLEKLKSETESALLTYAQCKNGA